MEQDVGLVVTKTADWIFAIVRITECANDQVWQTIQIKHFFEIADTVCGNVQLAEIDETIKADSNSLDVVLGQVELCELA